MSVGNKGVVTDISPEPFQEAVNIALKIVVCATYHVGIINIPVKAFQNCRYPRFIFLANWLKSIKFFSERNREPPVRGKGPAQLVFSCMRVSSCLFLSGRRASSREGCHNRKVSIRFRYS